MIYKPQISGEWQELFTPEKFGNYVNDHCVMRANDGKWHLFGITCFTSDPTQERYFVHGVGDSLDKPMTELNKVVDTGSLAWAPAVIESENQYYMYYGPSPNRMAVSVDLSEWMVYENMRIAGMPPMACHRDHMVLKLNDYTWIMYVSGLYKGYGCISVLVSNDLINWRFVQYALTSSGNAPLTPPWGAFESPYVVKYEGMYYLFTTYTDCNPDNYHDTLVFCSANPYDFGNYSGDNYDSMVVAKLRTHAGEIIRDEQTGQFYTTSCGWRSYDTPVKGGVGIAKLDWIPKDE